MDSRFFDTGLTFLVDQLDLDDKLTFFLRFSLSGCGYRLCFEWLPQALVFQEGEL